MLIVFIGMTVIELPPPEKTPKPTALAKPLVCDVCNKPTVAAIPFGPLDICPYCMIEIRGIL